MTGHNSWSNDSLATAVGNEYRYSTVDEYIQGASTKTLYPNIFFNYQLR
jgi:hypothetical protein